ncbi:MAG: hypothetical protein D6690_05265 [Nitrospirae bacterium]|nr:MAG: hypothetical protein D6690_05265 [Nitrospirota bacterium]
MPNLWTILNKEKIDALRELAGEDDSFLATLLDDYRATVETNLRRIREAIASQNAVLRQLAAHTLKGSSQNLGA